ncbi:S53 family peptidase [Amycolatopsis japonica]
MSIAIPSSSAGDLIELPGNVSPGLLHSTKVASLDDSEVIPIRMSLKLRNPAELDKFIAGVSDPHSDRYRRFLTPDEFLGRFGPTSEAVRTTTEFLSRRGLQVEGVSANHQVIRASGTAATVEKAFGVELDIFRNTLPRSGSRSASRTYYANATPPKLPVDVASVVQGIVGLDSYRSVRQNLKPATRPGGATQAAEVRGYTPNQLKSSYNTTTLGTGKGQSIALWEFQGYDQKDIDVYDRQFGLKTEPVHTVSVSGAFYDNTPDKIGEEAEADIEIVHAMAPEATIYVYEAPWTDQGEIDMAHAIAADNKVSVVSSSWGSCEPDTIPSVVSGVTNAIKQSAAQGISYFADSGDDGSADCTLSPTGPGVDAVHYPASDPNATGVGGTKLLLNGNGYGSETGWNFSGGGNSKLFPAQPWQRGGTARMVPDVAAAADAAPGYATYLKGQWVVTGGTSLSTPLWASFALLYNAKYGGRLGCLNPALSKIAGSAAYKSSFHDVVSGSNGAFQARPGYDQVTGWGSLNGVNLANALRSLPRNASQG